MVAWQQAVDANPYNASARYNLAILWASEGGHAQAISLLEEGVRAAREGHGQRARDLLGRVIEVDEKYVSAWMWLSYVADDEQERDR